jgi:hypothetical protein
MLTRRRFLQFTGIALVASRFDPLRLFTNALSSCEDVYGRALEAVPVYAHPMDSAPVQNQLWPDSVSPILDTMNDWYRVPEGYVHKTVMQPVRPYRGQKNDMPSALPFWAEVAAPVVVVRQWCAADAPLVTRIGHGGVMQIVDNLGYWYGVASESGNLLGWTQANSGQISAVSNQRSVVSGQQRTAQIKLQSQQLTAIEDGQAVLRAPISTGSKITPGTYFVRQRQIGGGVVTGLHGVPWMTELDGGFTISGVYWHNRFGEPTPGAAVQVTPMLARWLYDWLGDDGMVVVSQ